MADVIPFPTSFPGPLARAQRAQPIPGGWLSQLWQRHKMRRMLARELLYAPEAVLMDAGWSRAAVERELAKPIWRS